MHDDRFRGGIFRGLSDGLALHGNLDRFAGLDHLSVRVLEGDVHGVEALGLSFDSSFDGLGDVIEVIACDGGQNHGGPFGEGPFVCVHVNGQFGLIGNVQSCRAVRICGQGSHVDSNRIFKGRGGVVDRILLILFVCLCRLVLIFVFFICVSRFGLSAGFFLCCVFACVIGSGCVGICAVLRLPGIVCLSLLFRLCILCHKGRVVRGRLSGLLPCLKFSYFEHELCADRLFFLTGLLIRDRICKNNLGFFCCDDLPGRVHDLRICRSIRLRRGGCCLSILCILCLFFN